MYYSSYMNTAITEHLLKRAELEAKLATHKAMGHLEIVKQLNDEIYDLIQRIEILKENQ